MRYFFLVLVGLLTSCSLSDSAIRNAVVQLTSLSGSGCTGEQVVARSGKTYILTAGHCKQMLSANERALQATTESGQHQMVKIIAEDGASDLLLLEGFSGIPGLSLAGGITLHESVRIFSHGKRHPTYITQGEILDSSMTDIPIFPIEGAADLKNCVKQKKYQVFPSLFGVTCGLHVMQNIISAWAVPGSSGGPVLDDSGDLVGVVSAIDGPFTAVTPLSDIYRFLSKY